MASATGSERAHAQYAPSAAHRWFICPASVKATAHIESKSSVYAAEGTVAHHVLEQTLIAYAIGGKLDAMRFVGEIVDVEIEGKQSSLIVDKAMCEAVQVALDWLKPIIDECQDTWNAETRVTLADIGAEMCYGTSDFLGVVYVASRLFVVDYKHGAGVPVEVKDNEQLKIYGLGGLLRVGTKGITHVQTTIIQPRCPHPDGPIRSHTYTTAEMMDFASEVLGAIDRCEADNPSFVPGEHCKWCGIEDTCAARAKANTGIVAIVNELEDGLVLSIEERERLLAEMDRVGIEDFIASLRAGLHKYAEEGGTLQHYKLVPKRGSRVFNVSEAEVAEKLKDVLAKKKASSIDLYKMEFKSPAQVEEVIGKSQAARAVMAEITTSVSSGTNLVPIADPRREARISAEDEFDSLTD